jgi:hypothetical protein
MNEETSPQRALTEGKSVEHREPDTERPSDARPDGARSERPFGGLTPAEASQRAAAARRERKAEREAAAELDRLTVGQRVSTALARRMTYVQLEQRIGDLDSIAGGAHGESGAVRVQAMRELRYWLGLAGLDSGELPADDVDAEDMTPAQRAALRARILAELTRDDAASEPL